MPKDCNEVLAATLQVAKTVTLGERFQASRVRDHLGLPPEQGHNEPIRECWRQNRDWLKSRGLILEEEVKPQLSWWYLVKESHI